jgi:hypothetical protein
MQQHRNLLRNFSDKKPQSFERQSNDIFCWRQALRIAYRL